MTMVQHGHLRWTWTRCSLVPPIYFFLLYLDLDTVGSRGLGTLSRIAIQFHLFISCSTCLDSPFTHVSLERAHTSIVAELWLDLLILRRTCTGYRHSCAWLSASSGFLS